MNTKEVEASLLKNDCKISLKIYYDHSLVFWRGISSKIDFAKIQPRIDRKPRGTSLHMHEILNKVFIMAGFKGNRSNTVFCTGLKNVAKEYGTPHLIFPKDGFLILWSSKISDLYSRYPSIIYNESDEESPWIFTMSRERQFILEKNRDRALEELKDIILREYPFKNEIDENKIRGAKSIKPLRFIIMINYDFPEQTIPEMRAFALKIKEWIDKYAIETKNSETRMKTLARKIRELYEETNDPGKIVSALKSGNEIMVYCEYYYIVGESNFKEIEEFLQK